MTGGRFDIAFLRAFIDSSRKEARRLHGSDLRVCWTLDLIADDLEVELAAMIAAASAPVVLESPTGFEIGWDDVEGAEPA